MDEPRIGALNGVRALSAFTVLTTHCMIWSRWPGLHLPIVPEVRSAALIAVDVFMMLSGFLMVHTIHADARRESRFWISFYTRRIFRIAPVYYVCLFATLVLFRPLHDHFMVLADFLGWTHLFDRIDYSGRNIILHLSFLFGAIPGHSSSTILPDWSLGLEMQFYLVFPLLALAMQRLGPITIGLISIPICICALVMWSPSFPEPSMLLLKLPVFCAGMLLRYANKTKSIASRRTMVAMAFVLPMTQWWYIRFDVLWDAASAAFVALLTARVKAQSAAAMIKTILNRAMNNRLTAFGADISYSVYLLQALSIPLIGGTLFGSPDFVAWNPHARTAALFIAMLVSTTLAAAIVHRVVERPGIIAGRWVASRLAGKPPTHAPALQPLESSSAPREAGGHLTTP